MVVWRRVWRAAVSFQPSYPLLVCRPLISLQSPLIPSFPYLWPSLPLPGENLYASSSASTCKAAVDAWMTEASSRGGHYTQIVYPATTQVGCAIASCGMVTCSCEWGCCGTGGVVVGLGSAACSSCPPPLPPHTHACPDCPSLTAALSAPAYPCRRRDPWLPRQVSGPACRQPANRQPATRAS